MSTSIPSAEPTPEQRLAEAVDQTESAFMQALLNHFEFHASQGRTDEPIETAARFVNCTRDPEDRARRYLLLGSVSESARRYDLAATLYSGGVKLEPTAWEIWYWLNNNLGYSLNRLGRFQESARLCRAAIRADPVRHNAYKNLGIALQGEGLFAEAADAFITAIRLAPGDRRAFDYLEALVAEHREAVAAVIADIDAVLERFRVCVESRARAEEEQAASEPENAPNRGRARRRAGPRARKQARGQEGGNV